MLEAAKSLLLILSAIFPIVDPIGGSPFFLALTSDYSSEARKALARRIAIDSFVLLVGSYFVGTYILAFFGISLPVVQVGGGMVLVAMGWATLMENDEGCDKTARKSIEPQEVFNRAFYPLTLPLTVGSRINLRCHHPGRKCGARSPSSSFDNFDGTWLVSRSSRSASSCGMDLPIA
jgi:multiple antibiotic resistance protein